MSYEGYVEYLCEYGHHWTVDAYGDDSGNHCPECRRHGVKNAPVWNHAIDCTNGIEYDEEGRELAYTVPAELEVDHYEERVIKVPIYKVPKHE